MERNHLKCSVNPSNLIAPVKVNERIYKNINLRRKDSNFNYEKIKLKNFDVKNILKDEYITSRKGFINILVLPHIVKYNNLNE